MNCPHCGKDIEAAADTEASFEPVAKALKQRGFDAEVHASGGGIDVIRVVHGNHVFYFGTADVKWGASVYEADDENHIGETWTTVSSDEANPAVVADAIAAAVTEYERS